MDIINFSNRVRMGSAYPAIIDIEKIGDHESVGGIMATAFTYRSGADKGFIQIRKDNDFDRIALFAFVYDEGETDIPDGWKDSTVIWDSRS